MDSEDRPTPVNIVSVTYQPKYVENSPPMIFIHGLISSPHSWTKVRNKICENTGRKGYAVYVRNHGPSDWSDEMSIPHMAEDVKSFMAKERISQAILVGHSIGGRVALFIALENPEMVEKLIIEDMKLSIDDVEDIFTEYKSNIDEAARTLKELPPTTPESLAQRKINPPFMYQWSSRPTNKPCSEAFEPILPFSKNSRGEFEWDINVEAVAKFAGSAQKKVIPFTEETVFLGETLFIAAEYSVFKVLGQKELIQKHFLNSQFVCAKDIHHCCHLEKPELFVELVLEFLQPYYV